MRDVSDTKFKNYEILDVAHLVNSPRLCPHCNEMMQGPYTRYKRRESDLYFDLERKYQHCPHCSSDVEVVDVEILISRVSSRLPPSEARAFSMETNRLYQVMPDKVVSLLYSVMDEVQDDAEISMVNMGLLESLSKTPHDLFRV